MKQNLFLPKDHHGALWFYERRPYSIRTHQHDELEFNLVVRGSGAYLINGRKVEISPNAILCLFPGQDLILLERFLDLYGHGQTMTMLDAALQAGFGSYAQF